jgi:hypothetical protein
MRIAPADVRLLVQRALVGQVSPQLYGACVDVRDQLIVLTFYVAHDLSEHERDDLSAAGTMVTADFSDGFRIQEDFVAVDAPEQRGFSTIER